MLSVADRKKITDLVSDLSPLTARDPDRKKLKEWRDKAEKELEKLYGRSSDELNRFRRVRFFDFDRRHRAQDAPLSEDERKQYIAGLEQARSLLRRLG